MQPELKLEEKILISSAVEQSSISSTWKTCCRVQGLLSERGQIQEGSVTDLDKSELIDEMRKLTLKL
jgi:hypothetical protein